jgi:hypothetical protein
MSVQLIVGILAIVFGVVTGVAHVVAPDSRMFRKLGPMREFFGFRLGTAIHVVSYTFVPLVAGTILVLSSFVGGDP